MTDDVKKILEILRNHDEENQKRVLLETAATLGSKEWQEAVKDLIRRMEKLKK